MKNIFLLTSLLLTGCGSLTPALQSGHGFYSDSATPERTKIAVADNNKSKFETDAYGCFALSPGSVENKIIEPAVRKIITEHHAIAAGNIKATRKMTPTITDALTGAFIWGCSYWNVTGDLVYAPIREN
jgi:hypothetical protein